MPVTSSYTLYKPACRSGDIPTFIGSLQVKAENVPVRFTHGKSPTFTLSKLRAKLLFWVSETVTETVPLNGSATVSKD